MAGSADVRAIEQLESFYEHIGQFRSGLLKEIENLEVELRRLTLWLENEVVGYWTSELKLALRKSAEAQDALSRCMSYVRSSERRPCTEEKKRVQRTKARRELCEQKLRVVKAALVQWERERIKNQARVERCRDMADSDLLVAAQHLRGQVDRLTTYARLRSPAVRSPDDRSPDASEPPAAATPQPTEDGLSSAPPPSGEGNS